MYFNERVYSVLVVSSSEKLNDSLDSLLPRSFYQPVNFVKSVGAAQRALNDKHYDFVIINSPLPDDTGTRLAIDTCAKGYSACLLLVSASVHEEVNAKVGVHGVFTISKPLNTATFLLALKWMASTRERLRRFEKKELSVEEKMAEIRTISRAKILLVEQMGMSENDAHKHLEKTAMNLCIPKLEVAENIIKQYS